MMSWIQVNTESQSVTRKISSIFLILLFWSIARTISGIIKAFLFLLAVILIFDLIFLSSAIEYYFGSTKEILAFVPILVLPVGWLWIGLKIQDWRGRQDKKSWLAERSLKCRFPNYYRWTKRAQRWSLVMPSIVAAWLIFSLPIICGFASHTFRPRAGHLYKYEISIPLRWSAFHSSINNQSGYSFVTLLTAKESISWRQWTILFSGAEFTTQNPMNGEIAHRPDGRPVISRKEILPGGITITCTQYMPPEVFWPGSGDTIIECQSQDESFRAWFGGQHGDSADFYQMISGMRRTQQSSD